MYACPCTLRVFGRFLINIIIALAVVPFFTIIHCYYLAITLIIIISVSSMRTDYSQTFSGDHSSSHLFELPSELRALLVSLLFTPLKIAHEDTAFDLRVLSVTRFCILKAVPLSVRYKSVIRSTNQCGAFRETVKWAQSSQTRSSTRRLWAVCSCNAACRLAAQSTRGTRARSFN